MKSSVFLLITALLINLSFLQAQNNNRVSPPDSVQVELNDLKVKIKYSRPFLKGRQFGKDIVPFGKVWRTGANEATTFEINEDCMIEDKFLPAGKYSLYTIPGAEETVVIFNKVWDQWGTKYDEKQDALRVTVPTLYSDENVEQFVIDIDDEGGACMAWGDAIFTFHIIPVKAFEDSKSMKVNS